MPCFRLSRMRISESTASFETLLSKIDNLAK